MTAIHPRWALLTHPADEAAFLRETRPREARAGAQVALVGATLFGATILVDPDVPIAALAWMLGARVILFVAAGVMAAAAQAPQPSARYHSAQTTFLVTGLAAMTLERVASHPLDLVPDGPLAALLVCGAATLHAFPQSALHRLFMGALLIGTTVGALVATGATGLPLAVGALMMGALVAGSLVHSLQRDRARREAWLGTRALLEANERVSGLLDYAERARGELKRQAEVNPLTGALNRRAALSRAEALLATGRRVTAISLDLDHFKAVNDTHGHAGGDAALQHVVRLMLSTTAPEDVVSRWGGDEMLIFLADPDGTIGRKVAARLVQAARDHPAVYADQPIPIRLSVGVASSIGGEPAALLADADLALYAAKEAGRDRWVHAEDPPVDQTVAAR